MVVVTRSQSQRSATTMMTNTRRRRNSPRLTGKKRAAEPSLETIGATIQHESKSKRQRMSVDNEKPVSKRTRTFKKGKSECARINVVTIV